MTTAAPIAAGIGGVLIGAAVFMASATGAWSQTYPPSFTMQSLLATPMFAGGTLRLDHFEVAFVPQDRFPAAEAVLADEEGTILARHHLSESYQWQEGVFGQVMVSGVPELRLPGPGLFNLFFVVEGEIASRLPFLAEHVDSEGADPFATTTQEVTYDGLWRQLGYMIGPQESGFAGPIFTFWAGGKDLADPTSGETFRAALYDGSSILFHSRRVEGHIQTGAYREHDIQLFQPHEPDEQTNAPIMTLDDISALPDATYVLRVFRETDNAVIRTFAIDVMDGQVRQHERAVLGYEPAMDFIVPRVRRPGSNTVRFVEATWFETL